MNFHSKPARIILTVYPVKKLILFITSFLIIIIITPGIAHASSYYVSPSGNDSNSGTQSNPWRTIQKAANTVSAGDSVTVMAGDYSTQRTTISRSGTSSAPIVFQAQGEAVTKGFEIGGDYIHIKNFKIIAPHPCNWGSGDYGIFISGDYCLIENNHIQDSGHGGLITDTGSTGCTIRENSFDNNGLCAMDIHGTNHTVDSNDIQGSTGRTCGTDADAILFFGSGHKFTRNYIHDIYQSETPSAHIDGFQTWNDSYHTAASNILIDSNIILLPNEFNQSDDQAHATGFTYGNGSRNITTTNNIIYTFSGSYIEDADQLYFYNNTFISDPRYNNYPAGIWFSGVNTIRIQNNIFYNNPWQTIFYHLTNSNITISNNLVYNQNGQLPSGTHYPSDIWGKDPLFVDPSNYNYRLKSGSPAINAGAAVSVDHDIDGNSRPQGGAYDIGAFEYTSGGSVTPRPTSTPISTPTSVPTTPPTTPPTPSIAPIKPGDANADGKVDGLDYVIWVDYYGVTDAYGQSEGDFNNDHNVDGLDYVVWVDNYNT